jgi:TRAP-type C4-dicarboxylate transport system permease large subunit
LHGQFIVCLQLYERNKIPEKKHLLVFASFLRGFVFSSVQIKHQMSNLQQKKCLPIRTYFLMLCCFVCFSLAMDIAAVFFVGGPIFAGVREDFGCERLDLEDDATLTMRECW